MTGTGMRWIGVQDRWAAGQARWQGCIQVGRDGTSPPFQEMLSGGQDRAGGRLRTPAAQLKTNRLLPGGTACMATNALHPPGSTQSAPPQDGPERPVVPAQPSLDGLPEA